MSYGIIDFKNIVVKSFFKNESENVKDVKEKNIDHVNEKISENSEKIFEKNFQSQSDEISRPQGEKKTTHQDSFFALKRDRDRSKKLPLRYRDTETDISIFLQDLQNNLLMQNMQTPAPIPTSFVKSRKKEKNDLFEKDCFEIVSILDVFHGTRIFN